MKVSTQFNYHYNLRSSHFANPPPIQGIIYRGGQAGQIMYNNFDASYAVTEERHLGVNGYFLDAKIAAQIYYGAHEMDRAGIASQIGDTRLINLDPIELETSQIAERRVSDAAIVHRNGNAARAQFAHHRDISLGVVQQNGFSDYGDAGNANR